MCFFIVLVGLVFSGISIAASSGCEQQACVAGAERWSDERDKEIG